MAKTLKELKAERKSLQQKIDRVERAIKRHPDSVSEYLLDHPMVQDLNSSVLWVERASGHHDGPRAKVTYTWHGYRFAFKDAPKKVYWTRYLSSYHHSMIDCGVDGDEKCPDLPQWPVNLWSDNPEEDAYFEFALKQERHMAFAYALWFWEGF